MIEPVPAREAFLHTPVYGDPTWLETNWFPFIVPERNLRGYVYACFRSNLKVAMSIVVLWSGEEVLNVLQTDYWDQRVHLPFPSGNLDDYRLDNGLHVRMTEPLQRWEISYDGFKDMHLELEATAMMPAVTSHMTRLPEGGDFSHFHNVDPSLAAASGHIDQTMMMRGELHLRGERIDIAFASNRDHSWSPRPEFGHGFGYFDEGFFGEEFSFHVQTRSRHLDVSPVSNGYLLEHGEVILLKAGTGRYETDGWFTRRLVYELEDERGRSHRIEGRPTSQFIFPSWPNQFNIVGLTQWIYEGETSWGEYKWHWETSEMQARGGDRPTDPALWSGS
ncbi:hypothetical protein FSW04_01745 [Baekduia soli]|uniref:DUF7064 domain-containing protein n=1 Tax=Baekduia soli TaxID=496014 RepID=A0A5B8U0P5_9ACTN|nr:hypothetical protein [Baekduia soli]QEC46425.1 hypothetical protein FSW04_01745 [Baekduia soli]